MELRARCVKLGYLESRLLDDINVVVIDFDSVDWGKNSVPISSLKNEVIIGYARNSEAFHSYENVLVPYLKPILPEQVQKTINFYLANRKNAENVEPNNEPEISVVEEIDSLLDSDILSDAERMRQFQRIVKRHYKGLNEDEFFEKIGIDDIPKVPEPTKDTIVVVEPISHKVDLTSQFVEDALTIYRARKLRRLRLSSSDIEKRIKEIIENDIGKSRTNLIDKEQVDKSIDNSLHGSSKLSFVFDEKPQAQKSEKDIKSADDIVLIDDQRKEAIHSESNPDHDNTNIKSSKEVKPATLQSEMTVVPSPHPLTQEELANRLNKKMSPEQINRLRKLGVKI